MIENKKISVVLPAFNAEKTLRKTFEEIPFDIVDHIILTDDHSSDRTLEIAGELNIDHVLKHDFNKGYGANQKTCYNKALSIESDIIVMLHPDYQYTPKLIHSMCYLIANGLFEVVLGSRILGKGAIKGGMPRYKYIANRFLTLFQNILLNQKLSEYHTGYRAFSADILKKIDYNRNSDGYIFDNELLAQVLYGGFSIGEITCPAEYSPESSSIGLTGSIKYGLGVVDVSIKYFIERMGICKFSLFDSVRKK